jgi:hypothetical protein
LAVSLLLLLPQMSEAQCVCTYLPVCEAYKTSPAVVIAKAVGDQLVVSKVLHGSAPRTIKWQNTGECEAGLQQGEEYLVYPTRYRGTFGVGACTRRMTLAEAAEELKTIRRLASQTTKGTVYGYLITGGDKFGMFNLTLEGGGKRYEQSIEGGPWEFNAVRPGSYQLTIELNDPSRRILRRSVLLRPRGCEDAGDVGTP